MGKADLRIDWATHAAAKYACETWHYSKTLPVGKMVKVGAWEHGKFIGVVIFCWGMNRSLGSPYGLDITECCELVRVALGAHDAPVSRIMSLALRFLRQQSPGLRLVVSFADPAEGHHGGIYQATNWIYAGRTAPSFEWRHNGRRLNKRAYTGHNFGSARMAPPPGAVRVETEGKHRYLMPLDDDMRACVLPLSRPYPKRQPAGGSGVHPADRPCKSDPGAPPTHDRGE